MLWHFGGLLQPSASWSCRSCIKWCRAIFSRHHPSGPKNWRAMRWFGLVFWERLARFTPALTPLCFPAANLLRGSKGLIAAIGTVLCCRDICNACIVVLFHRTKRRLYAWLYRTLNGAQRRDVRVFNGLDQPCDPHWSGFGSGACFCGYRGTSTPSNPRRLKSYPQRVCGLFHHKSCQFDITNKAKDIHVRSKKLYASVHRPSRA